MPPIFLTPVIVMLLENAVKGQKVQIAGWKVDELSDGERGRRCNGNKQG